ncbi:MAG: transcriptional regulator, LysR family [Elusimicrobia bacterium]|nr:MAG: transcriptional regulator, LysR family [Elusimicrobiota bacterium]
MDLYQLRAFLEAARALNFTRAAEALHVSPSAVSRSVSLLERSVKTRLFARTKRHVALTSAGQSLKARAERIFDEVERAGAELAGDAAGPAELRLASREMITNYLLPGPLAAFKERYPGTRFGLHELGPAEMAAALKNDRLDLGFYYTDVLDPALESRHLGRLRSHVYASKAFLRAAGGVRDLSAFPFVAPRSFGGDPAVPRADGFPDHRVKRDVRYEAEFLETHRRFVLDGLCAGVLPDLVVEDEAWSGEVVALKGPPLHRDVYCFTRRGRPLPKATAFLIESTRKAVLASKRRL